MIKESSEFFQTAKFFPILNIYNSLDDQCIQICMNSKFDAILQPVIRSLRMEKETIINDCKCINDPVDVCRSKK